MPSVAGKRVLIFGDSLSYGTSPGKRLGQALTAEGATVTINARVGRSAYNFFGREDYAAQLATASSYDIVIVQLGTNDIGLSMAVDGERMQRIRDAFAQHADVWAFGPPSFPKSGPGSGENAGAREVVDMMSRVFGGKFLDLRPLSNDMVPAGANGRAGDGVHFTASGSQELGSRMAKTYLSASDAGALPMIVALLGAALAYLYLR